MMMNHDDILTALYASTPTPPHLIYVAIGCGMTAHPYGSHSPQQFPPQVAVWPGHKVCILIDEHFEPAPLYVFRDLGITGPGLGPGPIPGQPLTVNVADDATFIVIQRRWDWKNPVDAGQIAALCQVCIENPHTYMIVQDYTGEDPTPYYPLQRGGGGAHGGRSRLIDKVLFDMTQGRFGGECFVDFSKVHIRREPHTGAFVQRRFQSLMSFWRDLDADELYAELERRYSIATYTVYPHYLELRGRLEPKPWRSAEVLRKAIQPMVYTYGLPDASLTEENLRAYLRAAILDFTAAIASPMDLIDLERIIDAPERESIPHVLGLAKTIMMDSKRPPTPAAPHTETEITGP